MQVFHDAPLRAFRQERGISDKRLIEAIHRAERGLVDADLGGGVIKQRISRQAKASAEDIGR